jgi:hypothetical protein
MTKMNLAASCELDWDRVRSDRRLCHALDIAKQTVSRLAVSGYTDPHNSNNTLRPEKIISETALLLYATTASAQSDEVQARVRSLAWAASSSCAK